VLSQRERDTDAIALAQRKGVMAGELARFAADDRLEPSCLPIIEWFRKEVEAARGGGRLDELTERLRECRDEGRIRRRHRWQGRPAALELEAGDQDEDDWDEDDEDDEDPEPVSGAAGAGYAAELAAREWRWQPHGPNLCQLIHMKPHGWDVPPQECIDRAEHVIPGGAVCGSCYLALNTPLNRRNA
jgi:hypothetical protein